VSEADRLKWDAAYARRPNDAPPSPFLAAVLDLLPTRGRALDLAGGAGRNALLLARHGLDVTLADIAPSGLAAARRRAEAEDSTLRVHETDFDDGFPPGPWDVLIDFNFLDRRLFPALPSLLAPGGWFVFLQPTTTNLERHPRPSARFLLEPGELRGLLPTDLDVVRFEESWGPEGRHEARLVAQSASG